MDRLGQREEDTDFVDAPDHSESTHIRIWLRRPNSTGGKVYAKNVILTVLVPPDDFDFLQLELDYQLKRAAREFAREIKQHETEHREGPRNPWAWS